MVPQVCAVWPGVEPSRSVQALLGDLVRHLTDRAGSEVAASVWARRRGTDWWLASTGDRVDRCDVAQGPGPRESVLDTGERLVLPDIRLDDRWRPWRDVVLGQEFRTVVVLSATLARGDRLSLSLYGDGPEICEDDTVHRAGGFVTQMASLVDLHATIPERSHLGGPGSARRAHATVEQAVGVLMERRGCDESEAMHVLTVTAEARSTTVEQVADAVVEGAIGQRAEQRHP